MKPKTCPHCLKYLGNEDYYFSENLSLICGFCEKVVYPIDFNDELIVDEAKRKRKIII